MGQALASDTPVAIVGAGAMGSGIAQVAAAAGHRVLLYDASSGAVEQAIARIGASFDRLAEKGRIDAGAAQAARARLIPAARLDELAASGLLIEAIVEDLVAKQQLFRTLEAIVSPACLLATNTSSISVTAIAAALSAPGRLAGMHFFNPVPQMALVEVISGLATEALVADTLHATVDYFTLLDHLTIARSRKHIQKYYGTTETGSFPVRLPPINMVRHQHPRRADARR